MEEAPVSLPDYVAAFEKNKMCQGSSEAPTHRYFSPFTEQVADALLLLYVQ